MQRDNDLEKTLRTSFGMTLLALLSACGGGSSQDTLSAAPVQAASPNASRDASSGENVATFTLTTPALTAAQRAAAASPDLLSQPGFHVAPLLLEQPDGTDSVDNSASARTPVHRQAVPAEFAALSTLRLTAQAMQTVHRERALGIAKGTFTPAAGAITAKTVATFTPAQIRAAYGLPELPPSGTIPNAAQAAQMGAGQTIYIVDAQHDPNAANELAAFNDRFGLPRCTVRPLASNSSLPLPAAAAAEGCTFSVAYSTAAGGLTATPPAYEAGWATEIALDIQWAHATAPLARIVLIEAANASLSNLIGAVTLANAMGPGIVSMSFGGPEQSGVTASVDSAFAATGMTYLAATGDSGAGVSWPAVSSNVLAVGGTHLEYNGAGSRSERAWSYGGGGISQFTATPAYQVNTVPGVGTLAHRAVADVAFNADPSSGQYTAVMVPGSASPSWISVGGTSLSTPQWAGLIAIANAIRAQSGKPALGRPHATLYGNVASVPGNYAAALADITAGSNGTCATCFAVTGYDPATGLGTPNVSGLLSVLSNDSTRPSPTPPAPQPPRAPVVTSASAKATAGQAFSFKVSASAPNDFTYALSGAPSGMTIVSKTGVIAWAKPVAGAYAVSVMVKDSTTQLTGSGVLSLTVEPPPVAPTVSSGTVTGKAGTAVRFSVSATAPNAFTFKLAGAPSGMTINGDGLVTWAKPVAGTYSVTVTATDTTTKLSGKGTYKLGIAKALPPTIKASISPGSVGTPFYGTVEITPGDGDSVAVTVSGVPAGMALYPSGASLSLRWPSPRAGTFTLKITARNGADVSATLSLPIKISK